MVTQAIGAFYVPWMTGKLFGQPCQEIENGTHVPE
jgi:hypothetical protein